MAKMIDTTNKTFERREKCISEMATLKAQADKEQAQFESEWRKLGSIIDQDKRNRELIRQREMEERDRKTQEVSSFSIAVARRHSDCMPVYSAQDALGKAAYQVVFVPSCSGDHDAASAHHGTQWSSAIRAEHHDANTSAWCAGPVASQEQRGGLCQQGGVRHQGAQTQQVQIR
jgi:hypothetical protein